MRAAIAVVALLGCEHLDASPEVATPKPVEIQQPAFAPKPAPTVVPPDEDQPFVVERSTRVIEPRSDGLPNPPTDQPAEYKAWFDALPRTTQRKINTVCRRSPRSYQFICGGIGHLHIPYPPFPRARAHTSSDPTIWLSYEQWEPSLTSQQKRYRDRMCAGGEEQPSSDLCGDNTPLVVVFDGEPVTFTAGGTFPALGATDWPTAPWIVLDRDGNGSIDSAAELFGDRTRLPDGSRASNGFLALAPLDANGDRVIDARDPAFASLQLWTDDGDRQSTRTELRPLDETIVAISLAAHLDTRCDARGNCEGERAAITWRAPDGTLHTGAVVDVYLPRR
jgi:hypothetical protein